MAVKEKNNLEPTSFVILINSEYIKSVPRFPQASGRCLPILELLIDKIRGGPVINIDESPLQVMNEPGRSNTIKSYMWVFLWR